MELLFVFGGIFLLFALAGKGHTSVRYPQTQLTLPQVTSIVCRISNERPGSGSNSGCA